jgi:capsular polysaccharide biosynthesis protein
MKEQMAEKDDSMSLDSIRQAILDFFRVIFSFFGFLWMLVRKNLVLFILLPLAALAVSFYFFSKMAVVYDQAMIVRFNELNKRTFYEIFSQLNNLAGSSSYESLASTLGVKKEVAKDMVYIELMNLNNSSLDKDSSKIVEQPVMVRMMTLSTAHTREIQNALLAFINNNPYFKKIKDGQKKLFDAKLIFLDREMHQIDSLKAAYTNSLSSSGSTTVYNNAFDPADIYVQSNNLMNQKEAILKWMNENSSAINLVDGFKISERPVRPNVLKYMLIRFLGAVLLAFAIALLLHLSKLVKN